jgi:6-phosphogluconolactonase
MTCDEVAADAAAAFATCVTEALGRQPRFAVAVPGGSIATTVFPRIARLSLPWPRIDLTFVDERVVPTDDRESNLRAARANWIDRLGAERPHVIAAPVDLGDPDAVATAWQTALVETLGTPPRIDLAILGMGPDGHVASLFPGHALLEAHGRWTASLSDSPKPPPSRVTLTLDALAHAREIWVMAFGGEKAAAVADARLNAKSALPVTIVTRGARQVRWFLDAEAAAGLR